jgi:hypothetical protein
MPWYLQAKATIMFVMYEEVVVILVILWFRNLYDLFMYWARGPLQTPGFGSRFVSSLHCAILVSGAISYLAGAIGESTWLWGRHVTAGYLVHDFVLMVQQPSIRTKEDLCHHLAFLACLAYAHIDPVMYARGMLAEISLPFLYIGWAIIKLDKVKTRPLMFWVNSIVGVVLFFVFRVLNFTLLMWQIWHAFDSVVILAGAFLTAINYYWFAKLLGKACQSSPTADISIGRSTR